MSNPVFNRIDKEAKSGYAGFDTSGTRATRGYSEGQAAQKSMNSAQLEDLYAQPSAGPVQTGRVTLDDVLVKSGLLFGIMLAVAGATWFVDAAVVPGFASLAWLAGMFITLGLGLVIAFKKAISPALIVTFAVFEGLFVGGISTAFAQMYDGLVTTAIVSTLAVFVAMFLGWKTGIVRVTERSRRIWRLAIFGYLIFALVNLGFAMFGANQGWGIFGAGTEMGILVSVFAIGLASYTLAIDFDAIQRAVQAGAPEKYSWLLAHGLLVTVVWLYIEILRLLAHLQNR